MLREEQSADLAGQKQRQAPPEIDNDLQKKHHPDKRQIGITRQNLFCVIDFFVGHPVFHLFRYFQSLEWGSQG